MLTVACVWVKANVPYGVEYVANLRAMVQRHLARPHRFVCLTDRPWVVPAGIETIPVPSPGKLPGWWSKLELFNPAHSLGDRVLYLDLDTIVVRSLDAIVDYPSAFALVPHSGAFEGRNGLRVVKRFNSSVMVWDSRTAAAGRIFGTFTADTPTVLWGDQDHIGRVAPDCDTMPLEWFPRLSELDGLPPGPEATVVLCKRPKNEIAAAQLPWVAEAWRAA